MIKIFLLSLLLSIGVLTYADSVAQKGKVELEEIPDTKAKDSMEQWLAGEFGLKPHYVNYLLPFGYTDNSYRSYVESDEYGDIEAELQVSFKINIGNDLFGLDEKYYLSYSHRAFWQIYETSSPFRETNYNPEMFVVFPISDRSSSLNMRSVTLAYSHLSNGQGQTHDESLYTYGYEDPNNRSRGLDNFYINFTFQHETLITDFKIWTPPIESKEDSDNPDIMDYIGYAKLKFSYFWGKNMFTLMGRGNPRTGKGALEATYSYPLVNGTYLYAKVFTGYGESLIDYNNNITKFALGFSFSR
ncbi:MAG: phospholipase A [Campylobacterota bacterium]